MGFIRAKVSDESFAGWRKFCSRHGVSTSALVEAMGPVMGRWADEERETSASVEVVRRAREIDEERRRR